MQSDVSAESIRRPGGSDLCLACGFCCTGTLHPYVVLDREDVQATRLLGLTVETLEDNTFMFRQPCELYRNGRCSVHPHHPSTCQQYRCALLQKYDRGDVSLEEGLDIIRTAKSLLANASDDEAALPRSGEHLRQELGQQWDVERGLHGTGTIRQANVDLALRAVTFDIHLTKHFRLPKKKGAGVASVAAPAGSER